MATVRELVRVTQRAISYYTEVRELEVLNGAPADEAEVIAQCAATRHAIAELAELLEVDSCDL